MVVFQSPRGCHLPRRFSPSRRKLIGEAGLLFYLFWSLPLLNEDGMVGMNSRADLEVCTSIQPSLIIQPSLFFPAPIWPSSYLGVTSVQTKDTIKRGAALDEATIAELYKILTCSPTIGALKQKDVPLISPKTAQSTVLNSKAANPSALKNQIDVLTEKFAGYEKRDAHEFLVDLVDFLHEELVGSPSETRTRAMIIRE
eukprot:scaffold15752_cov83-Skeletonema_dohrnii-CCMP3373.AAC.8